MFAPQSLLNLLTCPSRHFKSATPNASSNTLELQANGSTLTAYRNGQFLFTFTDNSNPFTLGSAGRPTTAAAQRSAVSL
jgi:hypothetical protein